VFYNVWRIRANASRKEAAGSYRCLRLRSTPNPHGAYNRFISNDITNI
jgi:hypothetical protein